MVKRGREEGASVQDTEGPSIQKTPRYLVLHIENGNTHGWVFERELTDFEREMLTKATNTVVSDETVICDMLLRPQHWEETLVAEDEDSLHNKLRAIPKEKRGTLVDGKEIEEVGTRASVAGEAFDGVFWLIWL